MTEPKHTPSDGRRGCDLRGNDRTPPGRVVVFAVPLRRPAMSQAELPCKDVHDPVGVVRPWVVEALLRRHAGCGGVHHPPDGAKHGSVGMHGKST